MSIKKIITGFTLSLLLSSSVAVSADFNKGLQAAQAGDFKTALAEWTPLAEQGYVDAQYNLGLMYDNGYGVPESHKTAVKWYTKAAEQGDAKAQALLGALYGGGLGVQKDNVRGYMWLNLSAYNGGSDGTKGMGIFKELMTLAQIDKAQEMSDICLASDYTDC